MSLWGDRMPSALHTNDRRRSQLGRYYSCNELNSNQSKLAPSLARSDHHLSYIDCEPNGYEIPWNTIRNARKQRDTKSTVSSSSANTKNYFRKFGDFFNPLLSSSSASSSSATKPQSNPSIVCSNANEYRAAHNLCTNDLPKSTPPQPPLSSTVSSSTSSSLTASSLESGDSSKNVCDSLVIKSNQIKCDESQKMKKKKTTSVSSGSCDENNKLTAIMNKSDGQSEVAILNSFLLPRILINNNNR